MQIIIKMKVFHYENFTINEYVYIHFSIFSLSTDITNLAITLRNKG